MNSSKATKLTRRTVLKAGAGVTFAVALGQIVPVSADTKAGAATGQTSIGAWVTIGTDGEILIYGPAAEMGQGSMTALPVILAEEMDADWSMVRIEHSPIEPEIYGRGAWGGSRRMITVGSQAVRGYYQILRLAGAQIRKVVLQAAAEHWGVPVHELSTEPSVVVHADSGRRISYGEIVEVAKLPEHLPDVDESDLKLVEDFRVIGHSVPRHDVPGKVDGSAEYSIDVHVPGMVYGMVERSPVHNGRPIAYNKSAIRGMDGVITTVRLEYGIGVVADSVQAVMKAKAALDIDWEKGAEADAFNSDESLAAYVTVPGSGQVQPRSIVQKGDARAAIERAEKQYQADFLADHVYHAQMEPLNAVVSVSKAGDSAEAWVGTQATSSARSAIADTLGIDFDRVDFHPCYLGGGFGRRSNSDYVVEATLLSNAVKRPVKLIWSREDDLKYGQFRPMCLQRLEAGVNENGDVTAWTHCVVGDGGGLLASGIEIPFYEIPNQSIEMCSVRHGMRLKHWRAVGHGFNKFAIEAFVDEIADDLGVDPYLFRRKLLRNSPRALNVLDTVAEMSNWSSGAPHDHARGISFAERSGSLAAGVAEISVDRESGEIRVHKFWCAVDGGIIIQPDNAVAQIEGAIVTGLSSVLFERISVEDGLVQQSNFTDYRMMRMSETPEIEVRFIESEAAPSGLGEPGVPVTGGAVANAFATLTGKRIRHLPFSSDRVRAVLG